MMGRLPIRRCSQRSRTNFANRGRTIGWTQRYSENQFSSELRALGDDMPVRARIERAGGTERGHVGAIHQPDRRRAVAALPQDVGHAVAVEIGAAFDLPARPRVERTDGPGKRGAGAVHQPDRGRAVAALPEDVGLAVAVEVAAGLDERTWPL